MMHIDRMAHSSKLGHKSSRIKMIISGVSLVMCISGDSVFFSMLILIAMSGITVLVAGIPFRVFLRLLLIPGFFMIMALVGIAFDVAKTSEPFLGAISLGSWYLGVTTMGLWTAVHLFFRALGAASCLFFLILTTPISGILSTLNRWHLPLLILELSELTYRFLFVLMETGYKIRIAQNNRLGYRGLKNSFRSLGILISSVFIRSFKRSEDIYNCLESRGYNGTLIFLEEESIILKRDLVLVVAWTLFLIIMMLSLKNLEGAVKWIN